MLLLHAALLLQAPSHVAAPVVTATEAPETVADLTEREVRLIKAFSPLPKPPASPTNAWADHAGAASIGEKLFFDARLSRNGEQSCATCHDPELGWTDRRRRAVGAGGSVGETNTPTVVNAGHHRWQFWNGRADSLWAQALGPLESAVEMDADRVHVVRVIFGDSELREQWEAVFGSPSQHLQLDQLPPHARPAAIDPRAPFDGPKAVDLLDPAVSAWVEMAPEQQEAVNLIFSQVGKAIAAYERTLNSQPAAFDQLSDALKGGDQAGLTALSPEALHGWRLFVGRANCVACHFGPLFSDGRFHNLGFPVDGLGSNAAERIAGIRAVRVDPMNGRGTLSDDRSWQANAKLMHVASSEHVLGAFKTPSLRDVVRTAPYAHDGRFATLPDMLDYYSLLPGQSAHGHREETLKPLHLSDGERKALVAFLHSLTGEEVRPRPGGSASTASGVETASAASVPLIRSLRHEE